MPILGITASSSNHPYWIGLLTSSVDNKYITKSSTGDVYLGLVGPVDNAVKLSNLGALQWQKTAGLNNYGVAVDSSGNTYIAGYVPFTATTYLVKFDSSGAIVWQRKTTSISVPFTALAVDSSSNVYVGTSEGTLVKYNSSGTIQWQRKLASTAYNAITVDGSGNVFAVGYSVVGSRSDIQVVKYNSSGTIQWQTALSTGYTSTNTRGYDIKLDSTGNVIIAGIGVITGYNYFHVIKLNGSGVLQWQRYMTTLNGGAYGVAVDSSDNIYVTGYSQPFGSSVGLVFKYNSSGTIQWKREIYTNVSGTTYGNMFGIATGSNGEFYATGYVKVDASNYNGVTVKLPTDGTLTGNYVVGSYTVTYTTSSLSEAAASLTNTTTVFAETAGTLADTTATLTASNSSLTNTVKSI